MKVKIDSRGRVTIPEAIRQTLGFTDNAYLEVEGNKIIITKEFDPIKVIDNMLNDISVCECKVEYLDILCEAKKKLENL